MGGQRARGPVSFAVPGKEGKLWGNPRFRSWPPRRGHESRLLRISENLPGAIVSPLPIDRPGKIVCVGLNYRDHAEEQGTELPGAPLLFAKWPNALIGPGEPIVIPRISKQVDYEAELGVVIGERVRGISEQDALHAVRGYICLNDVSARDLQFSDGQWTRAKSADTFCPVGPSSFRRQRCPIRRRSASAVS